MGVHMGVKCMKPPLFGVLNIICATNQSHSCYCKCELAVGCSVSTGSLPALRNRMLKSSHPGE